ncbi:phosphotransferase [Amylibacter sp.]|nr:phosphotransferase [Amylibacter sp.]
MTKTEIIEYLTDIQLLTSASDNTNATDEKINFYYVRFGPVRILFCKNKNRITFNSFNLYQPGRRSLSILYKGLKIINDYAPNWFLGLFLRKIEIPPCQLNLRFSGGLRAVFLGAASEERKFICVYDDFIEKQCFNALGQRKLSNEISAMDNLKDTTLSNFIIPHKVIRSTDGFNILQTKFISAKKASKTEQKDFVMTFARSLLFHQSKNNFSRRGPSHGDFTPWNIRFGDTRSYIIDWENYSNDRPLLYDLFYFFFMQAALGVNDYNRDKALIDVRTLYEALRLEFGEILPEFSVAFNDWYKFIISDGTSELTIKKYFIKYGYPNV